jgi:peptidoglycan/xylan/chitin deacetylase (PgdA/CDA1 family)
MPRILLYHDVVDDDEASGFQGAGAAKYKLRSVDFETHLSALTAIGRRPAQLASTSNDDPQRAADEWMVTFDDGGVSGATHIADRLERRGWRGHFFITGNRINCPGFLDENQILDLSRRGHVIGSHSFSHPTRMSACTPGQLLTEWSRSRTMISAIIGKDVSVASIPGGYYSRGVAEAAAMSGIKHLLTSEPTSRSWVVEGCRVYGRYTIYRKMTASAAAAIAAGALLPSLRQAAGWQLKKVLKRAAGPAYLNVRRFLLDRQDGLKRPGAKK